VLPIVLLALFLAGLHIRTLQRQQDQEAKDQTLNIMKTIDRDLSARIAALRTIAASPLVDDPSRLEEFYRSAQGFRENFTGHIVLADMSTQMLLNTRVPLGSPLPKLPAPKGFAAAPYVMKTGKPAVGDMFPGPIAKEPLVAVVAPVKREGQTRALLLSIIETRQYQELLDDLTLPGGYSASILDSKGDVIARRPLQGFRSQPAHENLEKRYDAGSTVSHWSVVLEVPIQTYMRSLVFAGGALFTAIILVTVITYVGGRLVGRRLANDVESLTGKPLIGIHRTVISEIEAVRNDLDKARAERELSVKELRESEERYRNLFESANAGKSLTLPSGKITVNQAFCDMLGYERNELQNKTWQELTPPEDVERIEREALAPLLNGEKEAARFETRYLHKSGSHVWTDVSISMQRDREGKPLYFVTTVVDITERKRAEQGLHDSQERLQLFIEHAPTALAMFDRNMRYLAVSRRWMAEYSLGDRDIIGRSHYEIFPEIGEGWKEVHRRCLAGEVVRTEQDRFERSDGSVQWLRWEVRPWFSINGRIGGIIIFTEDITERKQAEEEIVQLNNRLQRLIQVIQQLSLAHSLAEIAEAVRTAARNLVEADGATFVLRDGNRCFYMDEDAISPLWKGSRFPLETCISGWAMLHRESVIIEDIYKDDRIPHDAYRPTFVKSLAMIPIHDEEPYGAIGIYWAKQNRPHEDEMLLMQTLANATAIAMENVKSYQELEKRVYKRTSELTQANLRLQELDRLKSMFIASMSHELRTPLNSIIGFTRIILMGMSGEISDVQRKQLGMVKKSARHLLDLINDVIDVSKIEVGNAVKFTESGGVVIGVMGAATMSSEADAAADGTERLKDLSPAMAMKDIEVTVTDTGVGIAREGMARLFEAFSRIHIQERPVVEGTGLGLYLSKRIADLLGGEIEVESEPGRGSTFTFRLPRIHQERKQ